MNEEKGGAEAAWAEYGQSLDMLVVIDEPLYERLRAAFVAGWLAHERQLAGAVDRAGDALMEIIGHRVR